MINLYGGKFYVADINYQNYSIRVVDPGLKKGNCLISSPLHSIGAYYRMNGFRSHLPYAWKTFYQGSGSGPIFYTILSMNCEQSISDHNYIPIIPCNTTGYSSSSSPTYSYAIVGEYVSVVDMPYSCTISTYMVIQPLKALPESSNLSMSDLQDYLLLGLQLSFLPLFCSSQRKMKGQICNCTAMDENTFQCYNSSNLYKKCE